MTEIILSSLATYAITLVISSYDGPFDIFAKFRSEWEKPWSCFVCLSFWVGFFFVGYCRLDLLEYLAVVGGAIVIWKVSER